MGLGVFLKGANAIHYRSLTQSLIPSIPSHPYRCVCVCGCRKPLDFVLEFIPQIIFLVGMFGYMDFLIVLKWITPIQGHNKPGSVSQWTEGTVM